jgi:hypothetical protein
VAEAVHNNPWADIRTMQGLLEKVSNEVNVQSVANQTITKANDDLVQKTPVDRFLGDLPGSEVAMELIKEEDAGDDDEEEEEEEVGQEAQEQRLPGLLGDLQ